jgi:hypothetical protein
MVINTISPINQSQPTPAPTASQGRREPSVSSDESPVLSILEDGSDFPTEDLASHGVATLGQTILQQPNLALASQGNHSPATVFSLLQD